MHPHSTVFFSNHLSETGFVRKSLHPAARALTRSVCKDEAVRATMMTADRKGDAAGTASTGRELSLMGVLGNTPILLCFSIFRISLVAAIPSITGS